jgi:hypothetical protein
LNPERSLIRTIRHHNQAPPQAIRYAPLSSGLNIVRKTLGGQQIAVARTTDIDRSSGTVNVTTVLLHRSGEWSLAGLHAFGKYPTGPDGGSALCRAQSPIHLCGIAGEDGLDGPDLASPLTPDRNAGAQDLRQLPKAQPQGPGDCGPRRQATCASVPPSQAFLPR